MTLLNVLVAVPAAGAVTMLAAFAVCAVKFTKVFIEEAKK